MDGPNVPMKKKAESEKSELKLQSECMETEVRKVQVNFKAINTLHCALNPTEFDQISTCKMQRKYGTS